MKTIKLKVGDVIPTGDGVRFVVCGTVTVVCRTEPTELDQLLKRKAREISKSHNRHQERNARQRKRLAEGGGEK